MNRTSRSAPGRMLYILPVLFFAVFLLSDISFSGRAVSEGISVAALKIIPSLFPFAVLGRIICASDMFAYCGALSKAVSKIFNLNPGCAGAVLLGFFCGFPVGAICAVTLFEKGVATKSEAERISAFADNAGLAFLLGTLGAASGNNMFGWYLFAAQTASSLICGIFLGISARRKDTAKASELAISGNARSGGKGYSRDNGEALSPVLFTESITGAGLAMLNVLSFTAFFTLICKCLGRLTGGICRGWLFNIIASFTEVSNGCFSALALGGGSLRAFVFCGFSVGFSGLSVLMQVCALFSSAKTKDGSEKLRLSMKTVVCTRFATGVLSALLMSAFCFISQP